MLRQTAKEDRGAIGNCFDWGYLAAVVTAEHWAVVVECSMRPEGVAPQAWMSPR